MAFIEGAFALFLQAEEAPTASMPLYLRCRVIPTADMPLYINGGVGGVNADAASFPLFLEVSTSSSFPLFMGPPAEEIVSTFPLYVRAEGEDEHNDSFPLYMEVDAVGTLTQDFPLFLDVDPSISANFPLYMAVGSSIEDTLPLYVRGRGLTDVNRGPMDNAGYFPAQNSLDLYIHCPHIGSTFPLYLAADAWDIESSFPLYTFGVSGVTNLDLPLYIIGSDSVVDTITLYVRGAS